MLANCQDGMASHSQRSRRDQVLELVAKRRSLKEIASELGIGESTVNYHVRSLKELYAVNSLSQLADIHARLQGRSSETDCRNSARQESAMSFGGEMADGPSPDSQEPLLTFRDALSYRVDAPWHVIDEPRVVPGVLEGTNASLIRGAIVVAIALGMLALVLLGLVVAQGITAALTSVSASPVT